MIKVIVVVAVVAAILLVAQSQAGHAQVEQQQLAYTTFDPDGLGLATLDGRYSLMLVDGCAIEPLVNVAYLAGDDGMPTQISAVDGSASCTASSATKIADVPCFTNDDGLCDAGREHN